VNRRAAFGLLAFVALWPAVTLVLQARWSVDPWKLMGFGMYAAPARRLEDVQLFLSVRRGDGWQPIEASVVAEESARFIRWRRSLGRLISADDLARAMLTATKADEARAEVRVRRLDATTARVVFDREVLTLGRDDGGP
jgi:hypothetical protein